MFDRNCGIFAFTCAWWPSSCAKAKVVKRAPAMKHFILIINIMESIYAGQAEEHSKLFLVAEHIAQDLTPYHQGPNTGESLTLENLQRVRRFPYSSGVMQNLAIGDQLDKTVHDL